MAFPMVLKIALCGVAVLSDAKSPNFLDGGMITESIAASSLEAEFTAEDSARLKSLEDALRTTFQSLPKDANGTLSHDAVRYAVHRMFIQRHGWFIKGLEPGGGKALGGGRGDGNREWVPSYLQSMLEQKLGSRGANLHDVTAFAASLEDLIDAEARGRLTVAYDMLELPKDTPIAEEDAKEVVKIYYISFLLSGNFEANSVAEAKQRAMRFTQRYTDWDAADHWMQDLLLPTFQAKAGAGYSFDEVARMVEDIGENYYRFNDDECHQLKGTLREIEGVKAGRVRLPFFYSKGMSSHWSFNERPEYLKVLGALDDSEPTAQQVIVPNYIMARPNCLEASGLYAICCRNECEDLMNGLEEKIGSATAEPDRIAELVAGMPSDTVEAPRVLNASLSARLRDIAESAKLGGKVPLYGRLFAQWMHHAYPRECPYPHEANANPQTPDEWMASQGEGGSAMSKEEMLKTVEADRCTSGSGLGFIGMPKPEDCGSATGQDLPWNAQEELLVSMPEQEGVTSHLLARPTLDIMGVFGVVAFLCFRQYQARRCRGSFKVKHGQPENSAGLVDWHKVVAFLGLATVAFLLDLLDGVVFGCALLGGAGSVAIQHFAKDPCLPRGKDADAFYEKCHV